MPDPETITLREAAEQDHTIEISAHQDPQQPGHVDLYFDTTRFGAEDDPLGKHECFVAQDVVLRGGVHLYAVTPPHETCSIPISIGNARHLYKDLQRIFEK